MSIRLQTDCWIGMSSSIWSWTAPQKPDLAEFTMDTALALLTQQADPTLDTGSETNRMKKMCKVLATSFHEHVSAVEPDARDLQK